MQCSECGHQPPAGSQFCNQCGLALERRCPGCDHVAPPESRFCNQCGRSLDAEPAEHAEPAPPPEATLTAQATPPNPRAYTPPHLADKILTSRSAIEGERKHVTVLFADVAGYTTLAERTDPEEMHRLMDLCFHILAESVHRFEGTVNQFTGDGIMALFGAPIALEHAPRQATQTALAVQRDLAPLRQEILERHAFDFQMRIGIHSGLVVVGTIGDDLRMDYTAVGDTTNIAARLQQIAEPGEVLISEATRRLVSGFFDLEDLGAVEIKGRAELVEAFRVIEARGVHSRVQAADARLTPLVGRQRELDTLRSAFESARSGRGQVAFLVGDPGIGKSRLLHELRRRLEDEPHSWFEGRCTTYGSSAAFSAIGDVLRRDFGIDDRDDDAIALSKVDAARGELGSELAWTLPLIRRLLSLPSGDAAVDDMDAITRRSETFRALQMRFLALAADTPLVLVIEDVHWVDKASEELIGFLSDSIPGARVLLILTHRSGYQHPFGDRSYHHRVALQALSEPEMSEMAHSLFDGSELPHDLRRAISERAEGNPFFMEEVTKNLVEEGVLRIHEGRIEFSGQIGGISVPDSIHDVLMARIDRLEEVPKRAIQVASVIGREFSLRLLERIGDIGDQVDAIVEELRALELIYEKASHPELAFVFKHALTHDVAYESVLVHRRKALHSIAGTAIEELYRDRLVEHYEALAHHFTLGEEWSRAFQYHELAAAKAAASYANPVAAEHCRAALRLASRLPEPVSDDRLRALEETLGLACWCVSDFPGSGEAFGRAAALTADPGARAANLGRAAYGLVWAHDYAAAQRLADESVELANSCGADAARSIALGAHFERETVTRGEMGTRTLSAESMRLAEVSRDDEAIVRALIHEAQSAAWVGEYSKAIAICERAIDIARGPLRPLSLSPHWLLGLALCGTGEYGRAFSVMGDGLQLADRIGDRALKARLLNSLGWCFAEIGCHHRAAKYNRQCTDIAGEMVELALVRGAPELYANGAINLAGNCIALGDLAGAEEHLHPIQKELDLKGDPWMQWRYALHVKNGLARVALERGDPERALVLSTQELEGARRHGAAKLQARALELHGRALVVLDRRPEAEQTLRDAMAIAERLPHPPVIWRALSLLSELSRRRGSASDAKEQANMARRLVDARVAALPERELQIEFTEMGERLATDPLGAYR